MSVDYDRGREDAIKDLASAIKKVLTSDSLALLIDALSPPKAVSAGPRRPSAERRIEMALAFANDFSSSDEAHHKAWVIAQMVRALTGDDYAEWVRRHKDGDRGPDTYGWDEGIAP